MCPSQYFLIHRVVQWLNGHNLFVDRNAEATDVVSSTRASARRIGRGEPRGECGRRGELREPGRKRSEAREKGGGRRGEPDEDGG